MTTLQKLRVVILLIVATGGMYSEVQKAMRAVLLDGGYADIYLLRFIKPFDETYFIELASKYSGIVFVEDGVIIGGMGEYLAGLLAEKGMKNTKVLDFADKFYNHGSREEVLEMADLMLYAQTLGLNTWWVGGTYNRKGAQEKSEGAKPVGIIAVGYGQTQGVPHKTKTAEQVSSYDGETPQWFKDGIEAALLAPTALAKQAFTVRGKGNKVSISCDNGIFTGVDTGLVKYHFELGAGKDNFQWE